MSAFPLTGYVRLAQICGNPKASPPIPAFLPIGKSTWYEGIRTGRFPKPSKLGPRVSMWRAEDIRRLVEKEGWKND